MTPKFATDNRETALREWVARFIPVPRLAELTHEVMACLPEPVRSDLVNDPGFAMGVYDPEAGQPVQMRLGQLRLTQASMGGPTRIQPGRSVNLRLRLVYEDTDFARYVIAHELAHAYLRNVCGADLEHVESAADRAAAEWGFPKPARRVWGEQNRRRGASPTNLVEPNVNQFRRISLAEASVPAHRTNSLGVPPQ